ncbi:short-chain dehydrogenase [Flavobacterium akiainvivens]|uniref:Short-chain dehydrogenase n=1 Tax=Flavobacterium akiainvivens TaxID=1202724 RepID=A0A0M8MCI0_9FLAO|nr:SDR family oxidoreductase [Flavobacterium akiainvivens]KOS07305.1 short-chain dehydrogenase [Flavobacterium akiainvivens]SFQ46457.1 NADP-dependent 3-hydroxy acid dehydrogenase YdfG [Flavobacterium akiainvivens]
MKTIFITGASTGLGRATAFLFQSKGWRVIATMRNPQNETELTSLDNVTLLPLDVTNPAQIEATVQQAVATGAIDVVFNNAGYGLVGPMEAITDEQLAAQIDTNLMGVMRVSRAFISHLRTQGYGLILITTSIGGLVSFPLSSVYHATKWALEGWAESMSFELGLHNIGIKTIAPGGIVTDFMTRSLQPASHPAYNEGMDKLMALFDGDTFSTAQQIADVVYEAATDGKDQVRYVAGEDAKALYARRNEVGNEVFRQEMGHNIFQN